MSRTAARLYAAAVALALSGACSREPAPGPAAGAQPPAKPEAAVATHAPSAAGCANPGAGPEPDAARLRAFVRGRSRQLRDCYQRALKRDASAGGRATLRFTIEPCGQLTGVAVASRTGKVDEAATCAVRLLAGWSTPFRPAEPVTVEYPVAFSASM